MASSSTPSKRKAVGYNLTHTDEAKKTALRTLTKFRDDKQLAISNNDIFKYTGFSRATGYRVLRTTDRPVCDETRGRPSRLSDDQIDQIIEFLEQEGGEARCLPWTDLCDAAGLEFPDASKLPCKETLRKALYKRGWKKCFACVKLWTCEDVAEKRDRWARERLYERELDVAYYRTIRYSDVIHFQFGWDGKIQITRNAGTRYCPDCVQHRTRPRGSGEQTVCLSAWACVGYGFKSKLIWYGTANTNGSITPQAYLDQILKPTVQSWLDRGDIFILEDDGASVYGGEFESNIIKQWKDEVGLQYFFDSPGAPDLSPVEHAWKSSKAHRKAIWDEATLKEIAEEGWKALKQSTIDQWCDSVPFKLLDVVKAEGYTEH